MNHSPAKFAPGMRLSFLDVEVLVLSMTATVALSLNTWWWGFIVGFTVAHFYLFCNVFRISRPLELIWAGVFVTLVGATIMVDAPGWLITVSVSLIATIIVIAIEMQKPSYHGIAWQRINPNLPKWWKAQQSGV